MLGRKDEIDDEENRSGHEVFAFNRLLTIADYVNQLLKKEVERRTTLEEEERLNSEQRAFMPRDFDWQFEQKYR